MSNDFANSQIPGLAEDMINSVKAALAEDIKDGDITAGLIPADEQAEAYIITREDCTVAGLPWVKEVFKQLDPSVEVTLHAEDGDQVMGDSRLFSLKGNARSLLTGERTALNFLQLLSGVATRCQQYAKIVEGTNIRILDTRKTIPGLRSAQKYAVTQGGCYNHRIGLYDAFLIKENHIAACGGIQQAIETAKKNAPGKPVEVEVEDLIELQEALDAGADIVMLDNFSLEDMREAVAINKSQAKLEASGNVNDQTLSPIAETGVDYVSIGALTKGVEAVDLSMRFNS